MTDKNFFGIPVLPADHYANLANTLNQASASVFKDPNYANEFHSRLLCWINDFHRNLEDDYEVGGQLASFGRFIEFHFTDIGYWNPSLISFIGVLEDGSPVELVQHVSQINILLIKKKRIQTDEPKRPIGFASWAEYEKFKNQDD
ncbi:DUF6173 family protein [Sodalis sp. RH22]|uniref:DUF6173 family protein n=1 Tax=unclassified Sodalis (in: enterobacteria) TaxID=2636512 RepID=UPI0039B61D0F